MRSRVLTCAGVVVLLQLLLMLGPAPASCAENALSFDIGVVFPTGDLNRRYGEGGLNAETGFQGGLGVEQFLGTGVSAGLYGRYYQLGVDELNLGDVHLEAWVAEFAVRGFLTQSNTRPFIVGGFLLGRPKIEGELETLPFSAGAEQYKGSINIEWSFGFHGGVGVMHMLSDQWGLFMSGEYITLTTDGKSSDAHLNGQTIDDFIEIEGNVEAWTVRMGLNLFFGSK